MKINKNNFHVPKQFFLKKTYIRLKNVNSLLPNPRDVAILFHGEIFNKLVISV